MPQEKAKSKAVIKRLTATDSGQRIPFREHRDESHSLP